MMNRRSLLPVVLVPSVVLLIPGAAMLLKAPGWAWSASDFVIAWFLIASAVFVYKYIASKATTTAYRIAAGIGVMTGFMLVWINGAVGFIGSENNPANRMYAGVLVVGLIGAALGRLEPAGMARALIATALAQFLVPVAALMFWPADFSPGVLPVFGLNFCFVLLFAASALLFRHAAGQSLRQTGNSSAA